MITYRITGTLYPGVLCEDFMRIDNEAPAPSVAITDQSEDDAQEIPAGQEFVVEGPAEDGWYDATVRSLTEESAKAVLAKVNGVTPAEIEIVQQGVCASM